MWSMLEKLLEKERGSSATEAERFPARFLGGEKVLLFEKRGKPFSFEPGDVVGVAEGGLVEPLGVVLDATSETLIVENVYRKRLQQLREVELADAELTLGYDLQLDLLKRVRGGKAEVVAVFNEKPVELFEGAPQKPLGRVDARTVKVSLVKRSAGGGEAREEVRLDESQSRVVNAALELEEGEVLLVVGPPGTGKTTTIAGIAEKLAERGERVLISSHTNRAVDNAVGKLPIDFTVRVGRPEKVLREIEPYLLSYKVKSALGERYADLQERINELLETIRIHRGYLRGKDRSTFSLLERSLREHERELRELLEERRKLIEEVQSEVLGGARVVGSTLIKSQLYPLRDYPFDTVIIDEASQVSVTLALLAMVKGRKWIVVGDHKQLLPIFRSEVAREELEDLGAFTRLMRFYGEKGGYPRTLWLRKSYRSHPDIVGFAARYVYEGKIKPAAKPKEKTLALSPGYPDFLEPRKPFTLIHVDSQEERRGGSRINEAEARVCYELVDALTKHGVPQEEIGVITPYRAQRSRIKEYLQGFNVEVNTVDAFQGREKDVVIFSLTATREDSLAFAADANRLNVAITRARKKLLFVANANVMEHGILKEIREWAKKKKAIYDWRLKKWK